MPPAGAVAGSASPIGSRVRLRPLALPALSWLFRQAARQLMEDSFEAICSHLH
ncbi:MAG: hypothetical protein OXJ90_17220 [Spirochaetaceae bacterium]|nr:hypothetical protein [Spirochaetaceae bacterium]